MEIRPTASFTEKILKKRQLFAVSLDETRGPRDGKAAHQHPEGQLSVVADGLLIIGVEGASLMLPPRRIGWIPPETMHAGASYGTRMGWVAYLHRNLCAQLPKRPTVLKLTTLTEAREANYVQVEFVGEKSKMGYTRLSSQRVGACWQFGATKCVSAYKKSSRRRSCDQKS